MPPIKIENEGHLKALHARYFTVSRLGSLYGEGFTSKWQEYQHMRGALPFPELNNKILERGTRMQVIARPWIMDKKPDWTVSDCSDMYPHPAIERFAASPDLILWRDGNMGCGEVKVVNSMAWKNDWANGDNPPLRVELQLQGQIACAGATWGAIIAIVIGTFEFEMHIFERDRRPKTIAKIETDVQKFLDDVANGNEPPVDYANDAEAIAEMYRDSTPGKTVDMSDSDRLPILCSRDLELKTIQAATEKERKAIKAEIFEAANDAEEIKVGNFRIKAGLTKSQPDKIISVDDIGMVIKGRAGYRQCLITEGKQHE